ncbi:MAG: hypothetical protein MOGMAGMI_00837 [Candidatus Omnitrophica bacterium]|nr:hypothetical protein [Candidatus Omnitrophota bacterium]
MTPLRTVVTGAGSGVGQGVVKALRRGQVPVTVITADIHPLNAGLYRGDEALLIPKVESDGALGRMIEVLRRSRAQAVLIGSEFDLEFFSVHREEIERATGAVVIVSPPETVRLSHDKHLTAEFLRRHGLPYAESLLPASADDACRAAREWGYPVLIKPRSGTSSRHVHVLSSETELRGVYDRVPGPLLQRLIGMPSRRLDNEYTCSVFRTREGRLIGPFTARRVLKGGHSWIVEVDTFQELHPLLLSIAERLPFVGSLNVQLMVGENGPVPFEFNARFSGTTAVRAYYGFNEPEMALRSYVLRQEVSSPSVAKGVAFRYSEEVFVNGVTAGELSEPLPKGEVPRWF